MGESSLKESSSVLHDQNKVVIRVPKQFQNKTLWDCGVGQDQSLFLNKVAPFREWGKQGMTSAAEGYDTSLRVQAGSHGAVAVWFCVQCGSVCYVGLLWMLFGTMPSFLSPAGLTPLMPHAMRWLYRWRASWRYLVWDAFFGHNVHNTPSGPHTTPDSQRRVTPSSHHHAGKMMPAETNPNSNTHQPNASTDNNGPTTVKPRTNSSASVYRVSTD